MLRYLNLPSELTGVNTSGTADVVFHDIIFAITGYMHFCMKTAVRGFLIYGCVAFSVIIKLYPSCADTMSLHTWTFVMS